MRTTRVLLLVVGTLPFASSAESAEEVGLRAPKWVDELRAGLSLSKGANWQEALHKTLESVRGLEIGEWWLVGPFPFPDRKRRDYHYGPEEGFDPERTYKGSKGGVQWKRLEFDDPKKAQEYVEFTRLLVPKENGIAYARVVLNAPEARAYWCSVVFDDTLDVWVNGAKVHSNPDYGRLADLFPAPLKEGGNEVVVRVAQGGGDWGLQLRFHRHHPRRLRIAALYALVGVYAEDAEASADMLFELYRQLRSEGERDAEADVLHLLYGRYSEALLDAKRDGMARECFGRFLELGYFRSAAALADRALAGELKHGSRTSYQRTLGQWSRRLGLLERAAGAYRDYVTLMKEGNKRALQDARRVLDEIEKALIASPIALPVSEELAEEWRRAELIREMGDWPQYADALHNVLERASTVLVERDDGVLVGISGAVLQKIRALPVEARRYYLKRYGVRARTRLEKALRERDPIALEAVARAYPGLPEAAVALSRAGDLLMERGRWRSAMYAYLNSLRFRPTQPALVSLKALSAAARSEDRDTFAAIGRRFRPVWRSADGHSRSLAGGEMRCEDYAAQLAESLDASSDVPPQPDSIEGLSEARRDTRHFVPGADGALAEAEDRGYPYAAEVDRDGWCFFQVDRRLWALKADGSLAWQTCPTASYAPGTVRRGIQVGEQWQRSGREDLKPSSDGRGVFARLLWLEKGREDSPRWAVFAFRRGDGRLLWSSAEMPDFRDMLPCSNPCVFEGKLVTLWLRPREISDIMLVAQQPETGEVVYTLPICSGNLITTPYGKYTPILFGGGMTCEEGRVYVDTAAGTVAAVDLFGGSFLWAARYPRRADWENCDWSSILSRPRSDPVVSDGVVAVWPRDTEVMCAFSAEGGEPLWRDLTDQTQQLVGAVRPREGGDAVLVLMERGRLVGRRIRTGETAFRWRPGNEDLLPPASRTHDGSVLVQGRKALYIGKVVEKAGLVAGAEPYPEGWHSGRMYAADGGLYVLGRSRIDRWSKSGTGAESNLPSGFFRSPWPEPGSGTSCQTGTTVRAFVDYHVRKAHTGRPIPGGYVLFEDTGTLAFGRVTPDFRILWRRNFPGRVEWRALGPERLLAALPRELWMLDMRSGDVVWRSRPGLPADAWGGDYEHVSVLENAVACANKSSVVLLNRNDGSVRWRWRIREHREGAEIRGIAPREDKISAVYYDGYRKPICGALLDAKTGEAAVLRVEFEGTYHDHRVIGFSADGRSVCLYLHHHGGLPILAFDTGNGRLAWKKELKTRGDYSRTRLVHNHLVVHPHDRKPAGIVVMDASNGKELMRDKEALRFAAWGERHAALYDPPDRRDKKARLVVVGLPSFKKAWEKEIDYWYPDRGVEVRVALDEERDLIAWVVPRLGRPDDNLPFNWSRLSNGEQVHKLDEGGLNITAIALADGALVALQPGRIAVLSGDMPSLPKAAPGEAGAPPPLPEEAALRQSRRQLANLASPDEYRAGWLREVDAAAGTGSFWNRLPRARVSREHWVPLVPLSRPGRYRGARDASLSFAVARERDVCLHIEIRDNRLVGADPAKPGSGDLLEVLLGRPQPRSINWGPWWNNRWVKIALEPADPEKEPRYTTPGGHHPTLLERRHDLARDVLTYDFKIPLGHCLDVPKESTYPEETHLAGIMAVRYTDDDGGGRKGYLTWGGSVDIPALAGRILHMPKKGEFAPNDPVLEPGRRVLLRQGIVRIGEGSDRAMKWRTKFIVSAKPADVLVSFRMADTRAIGSTDYGAGIHGAVLTVNGRTAATLSRLETERVSPKENWVRTQVGIPAELLQEGENTLGFGYTPPRKRGSPGFDAAQIEVTMGGE